eukprot:8794771-Pyramimonas_sp.AAC.3
MQDAWAYSCDGPIRYRTCGYILARVYYVVEGGVGLLLELAHHGSTNVKLYALHLTVYTLRFRLYGLRFNRNRLVRSTCACWLGLATSKCLLARYG